MSPLEKKPDENSKTGFKARFKNTNPWLKSSSRVSLIRDLDDRYDKLIFVSLVFGGIFLIISTRIIGDNISSNIGLGFFDWLAITLAVFLIAGYAFFVYLTSSRSSLSIDRASDNVYYLGLLYTLASLSYSLIKLGGIVSIGAEPNGEEASKGLLILSLLPDFGLALASTIAGIFSRVLLQQMRGDTVDVEGEARLELGEAARSLRSNIQTIVSDLKILSTTVSASLQEVNKEMIKSINLTADENVKIIKKVADELNQLTENTDAQVKKMGEFTEKTTENTNKIIIQIMKQLEDSSRLPDSLNQKIKVSVDRLDEMNETIINNNTKNGEAVKVVLESMKEVLNYLNKVDIGRLSDQLNVTHSSLNEFNNKMSSVNTDITESSTISRTFTQQQRDAAEVTKKYLDVLEEASNKISVILKG